MNFDWFYKYIQCFIIYKPSPQNRHLVLLRSGFQTRRHGGHTRAVPPQLAACPPPQTKIVPPSEDCALKKLIGSGLLERKSRSKLVFFVDWHQILWRFWDENLFFFFGDHLFSAGKTAWICDFGPKIPCNFSEDLFLEIICIRPEKPLEFTISAGKSLTISVKTFFLFLEITCFWPEKLLEFPISAGKSLWLFAPHFVYFIQTGMNLSCPCAPLEFTHNKRLVPPKICLCPPSHAILAPALLDLILWLSPATITSRNNQ